MGRIWSEAARDKLEKESDLYLKPALFIQNFDPQNDVLKSAWDNIITVMKYVRLIINSTSSVDDEQQKDDVSSIINDCRSKVLNQLQYICDNHDSQAFPDFLARFNSKIQKLQQAPSDAADTGGKTKELTKLELQQQKDYENKLSVCLDKQGAVSQFSRGYHKTKQFMLTFINPKGPPNQDPVLLDAFRNISNDYHSLFNLCRYDEKDNWYHLDVSQLIKEYKSKLETQLKEVCNNVSDPTIKEAFSRHLAEVTAQDPCSHLHNKDAKRTPELSLIRKKKSSLYKVMKKEGVFSAKTPRCFEVTRHRECCFKKSAFGRMRAHAMSFPPKAQE